MKSSRQLHVGGTSVAFPSASATFALFRNTSAVSVDVTVAAVTETVATGGTLFVSLTAYTSEVSCVRTDADPALVDVTLTYGFDEETISLLQEMRAVGKTGGKLGFLGATPIVRRVGAAGAAVTATAIEGAAGVNPTQAEYATAVARINALTALANELRATLVAFGIHKGAA